MLSTIKVRDVGPQISINVQHADINADGIERQIKAKKYTDISYRTEWVGQEPFDFSGFASS